MKLGEMTFPPLKILLLGSFGVGKTAFELSFGEGAFVLNIGQGLMTGLRLNDPWTAHRHKVEVYDCVETNPLTQAIAYRRLKSKLIEIVNLASQRRWVDEKGLPYELLIIDDLTFLFDATMRYIMGNVGKLGKEINPSAPHESSASQPEWGLVIKEVLQIIDLINAMPTNVVLAAHTTLEDFNGIKKNTISVPTQKLPSSIVARFDERWFIETTMPSGDPPKPGRRLRTVASPYYDATSRAGLPDNTNPDAGLKPILLWLGQKFVDRTPKEAPKS